MIGSNLVVVKRYKILREQLKGGMGLLVAGGGMRNLGCEREKKTNLNGCGEGGRSYAGRRIISPAWQDRPPALFKNQRFHVGTARPGATDKQLAERSRGQVPGRRIFLTTKGGSPEELAPRVRPVRNSPTV